MEEPLFPLLLFIYDTNGRYGEPIQIVSTEQLYGVGVRLVLRTAMSQGVEIRMVDPQDYLVFHANHGNVIFPAENVNAG